MKNRTSSSRGRLLLHLLLGCYAAVALFLALGLGTWGATLKLALLAFEYAVVLPGILWCYRAGRMSGVKVDPLPLRFPALLVYAVAVIPLAWFVNQAVYSGDESAYLFQARIFSTGRLAAEAPIEQAVVHGATPEDFRTQHHILIGDKWFGKYSPGWPAILTLGTLLRAEWIVNPLLGLLILFITYRTAATVFDGATARLATMILVASPFFVLNCTDFMSHTACSVFLAGAIYFFFVHRKSAGTKSFVAMVALLGIACTVRPYTSGCVAIILGGTCFWAIRRETGRLLKLAAISLAGAGATVAALLIYNRLLTGVYWPVTYAIYRKSDEIAELDFGLRNLLHNITNITSLALAETVLAAFPFVMALAAYALFRDREKRVEARVLAASFAVLILAYLGLVEHSFSFIGERYYFETYFALAILAARGWILLVRNWNLQTHAVRVTVASLFIIQALQYPTYIRIARNVRESNREVQAALAHLNIKNAVVFLKKSPRFRGYDLNLNQAEWKKEPAFFIKDPGAGRRDAVACALGRSRWMVVTYDDRRGAPVMLDPVMSRCESIVTNRALK